MMSHRPGVSLFLVGGACASLALGASAVAHDDQTNGEHTHPFPSQVAEETAWRPTANPDRIVLTWKTAPATSQAVTWRTDVSVTRALAELAVAGDGPQFVDSAKQSVAVTKPFRSDLGVAHYHSVNLTDLKPCTKYAYRVGDGDNWSEWSHFTTASNAADPFTFVYFGDAQNDLKLHWSRVAREAFKDAPRAAFLLHAGDLVNRANRDAEWGEWFYAQGFISRTMPCIAVPGNHEYQKATDPDTGETIRQLSSHWQPTFTFPENGPKKAREAIYWVDYQDARIVALNSNEDTEFQAKWLETVLTENTKRWTIVTFHHPIYSSKVGRDNPELRDLWQPIFDKHHVDLVLNGHDHTYARTKLMAHGDEQNMATGVRRQSETAGTVYVVSVSGPKMYELGRRPVMRRAAEGTQLYQIITVDGDELRYQARTAIGRPYDGFALRKRKGMVNLLVEQVPDVCEFVSEPNAAAVLEKRAVRQSDGVPIAAPTVRLSNPAALDQDDLCIWHNVEAPGESTVITSDKTASRLFVYDLQGNLVQQVEVPKPGNIDIRSGFPFNGDRVDLVVVNQRTNGFRLCVFKVDPKSRQLVRLDEGNLTTGPNYGGCLYHSLKTDKFYFVTTSEEADAEQYELIDDGNGHVTAKLVRHWPIGKSEGAVADDASGRLYIAEEEKGIRQLDAEPSSPATGKLIAEVGQHGIVGDIEGITVTTNPQGEKYLVFSDQGSSTMHVLPLDNTIAPTQRFAVEGAKSTDGLDVLLAPLGKDFPSGVFACHSDDPPCPILLTPVEHILEALQAPDHMVP